MTFKKPTITVSKASGNIGADRNEPIPEGPGRYKIFLGHPTTVVLPGGSSTIMFQPQVCFRPRRLVVAPECAPFFQINDIRVGACSFLLNSCGAPASCFPPLPTSKEEMSFLKELEEMLLLEIGIVQMAQIMSVHVTNVSPDKPQSFGGMFWGETLNIT